MDHLEAGLHRRGRAEAQASLHPGTRHRRPDLRDPGRSAARRWFGLPEEAPVISCYEAGRDGFWLHRYLEHHRVENLVVDSASIQGIRSLLRKP